MGAEGGGQRPWMLGGGRRGIEGSPSGPGGFPSCVGVL